MGAPTVETVLNFYVRARSRIFTFLLSGQFKKFGEGSRICPPFRCYGLKHMTIGENVIIHRDCWIQAGADSLDGIADLTIGSGVGIGMGAHISVAKRITIGDHVFFGRNVFVSDHAHAFEDIEAPISAQGINRVEPVSIGQESWLGENVVVLPGVHIGRHCVIGANSVVNRSVPDYSVAVGAPARVVKRFIVESGRWEKVLTHLST